MPYHSPSNPLVCKAFSLSNGHCFYCGLQPPLELQTLDYPIPSHENGPDEPSNRVPCCHSCRKRKGLGHPDRLRRRLFGRKGGKFWGELNPWPYHIFPVPKFGALQREADQGLDRQIYSLNTYKPNKD